MACCENPRITRKEAEEQVGIWLEVLNKNVAPALGIQLEKFTSEQREKHDERLREALMEEIYRRYVIEG